MKKMTLADVVHPFHATPIGDCPSIGPYAGITRSTIIRYPNGRALRFALYAAYNAFGLIGPEKNGIVILDEDARDVVCDEIAEAAEGGYFGPTAAQIAEYDRLTAAPWRDVVALVDTHPRARRAL